MTRLVLFIFFSLFIALVRGNYTDYGVKLTKKKQLNQKLLAVTQMSDPKRFFDFLDKVRSNNTRFEIAATFGDLTVKSFKKMDKYLKIMVGGLVKAIKDIYFTTWDDLLDYLDKVPYLKMFDSIRDGFTEGMIEFKREDIVKLFKDIDHTMIHNIEDWFYRLIGDPTVFKETNINIKKLARMAATQIFKYNIENLIVETDISRAVVVDMAILRFPDIEKPFLQVFVFKVYVHRKYFRFLWLRKGSSVVVCKYNMVKYRPNRKYMDHLKEQTKESIMKDIDDLFS